MHYQQVHSFSAAGAERFAAFLYQHGRPALNIDACRLSCLGSIEEALNSDAPLSWTLSAESSSDAAEHVFSADWDDLIVETVVIPGAGS